MNESGQAAKVQDAEGRVTFYEYDHLGRIIKISDAVGI
jgi:YD repeat-containing protein